MTDATESNLASAEKAEHIVANDHPPDTDEGLAQQGGSHVVGAGAVVDLVGVPELKMESSPQTEAKDETDATPAATVDETPVRIFVGDIAAHTTAASLTEYFSKFASVSQAVIKVPSSDFNRMRAFGFISIAGEEAVRKVLAGSHAIDGQAVTLERAKQLRSGAAALAATVTSQVTEPGGGRGSGVHAADSVQMRKIFVGGISHQTKEADLRDYFSTFGAVADVVVMTEGGNTRRPRGFGFVTFEDAATVGVVCHRPYHPIDNRQVEVKPAISRDSIKHARGSGVRGAGSRLAPSGGGWVSAAEMAAAMDAPHVHMQQGGTTMHPPAATYVIPPLSTYPMYPPPPPALAMGGYGYPAAPPMMVGAPQPYPMAASHPGIVAVAPPPMPMMHAPIIGGNANGSGGAVTVGPAGSAPAAGGTNGGGSVPAMGNGDLPSPTAMTQGTRVPPSAGAQTGPPLPMMGAPMFAPPPPGAPFMALPAAPFDHMSMAAVAAAVPGDYTNGLSPPLPTTTSATGGVLLTTGGYLTAPPAAPQETTHTPHQLPTQLPPPPPNATTTTGQTSQPTGGSATGGAAYKDRAQAAGRRKAGKGRSP